MVIPFMGSFFEIYEVVLSSPEALLIFRILIISDSSVGDAGVEQFVSFVISSIISSFSSTYSTGSSFDNSMNSIECRFFRHFSH